MDEWMENVEKPQIKRELNGKLAQEREGAALAADNDDIHYAKANSGRKTQTITVL